MLVDEIFLHLAQAAPSQTALTNLVGAVDGGKQMLQSHELGA